MTHLNCAVRFKQSILAMTVLAVAGCTTIAPPGGYQEPDFSWEVITLPTSYLTAHRRLVEGFRQCRATTGNAIFPTLVGVPDCFDDREREVVLCDVYVGAARGGRSNRVLGRIELSAVGDSETKARVGVVRRTVDILFSQQSNTSSIWFAFLRGEESCKT